MNSLLKLVFVIVAFSELILIQPKLNCMSNSCNNSDEILTFNFLLGITNLVFLLFPLFLLEQRYPFLPFHQKFFFHFIFCIGCTMAIGFSTIRLIFSNSITSKVTL